MNTVAEDSLIIAYPGEQTGSLNISAANELNSLEVLYRQGLLRQGNRELDLLVGYRYGRFNENVAISQTSNYLVTVGGSRREPPSTHPICSPPATSLTAARSDSSPAPTVAAGRSKC